MCKPFRLPVPSPLGGEGQGEGVVYNCPLLSSPLKGGEKDTLRTPYLGVLPL
jgi:hypothetical protein